MKAQGKEGDFSVTVCVTTLYSYIDKGIFLKLSNKNLPVKKDKKRNYKKVQRQQKRAAAGESIDKRPKEIDTREEFGNWEMDSVLGKRGKSKNTLLVLTERKTRNEIIFKLPDHTDEAVVAALDRLERKWGADMFKRVFKTINHSRQRQRVCRCRGLTAFYYQRGRKADKGILLPPVQQLGAWHK